MSVLTIGDKRLGAALIELGFLSDEDLQKVLERYREIGGSLADVAINMGLISEQRIAQAIEGVLGIPLVNLHEVEISPQAKGFLTAEKAQELEAIPFALEGDALRVAFVNPLDSLRIEEVEDLTGHNIEPYQVLRPAFQYSLAKNYPELRLEVPPLPKGNGPHEMRLGDYLVEEGLIKREQLEHVLVEQERTGELMGKLLIGSGLLNEVQLYRALARQAGIEFINDTLHLEAEPEVASLFLRADVLRYQAIPLREKGGKVLVVTADTRHVAKIQDLLERPTEFLLTTPLAWEELFERTYPEHARLGEALMHEGKIDRDSLQQALKVQYRMGKTRPLSEVLVELGYVKPEDIEVALAKQRAGGGRLEDTLIQSGKIQPEMLAKSLAIQLGYPFIDPVESLPDPSVTSLVPEVTVRRYTVLPHHLEGGQLVVLMKDPRNIFAIDDLRLITKLGILPAVATEEAITKLIERFYAKTGGDLDALTRELEKNKRERREETRVSTALDDSAVVRLVNTIIREAYLGEASDIHIEPREGGVFIRTRVDGGLREYMRLPKTVGPALTSRIKIMGNLDIAERRLPQDGRVRYRERSIDLDLRLSTLPTVYGEKVVMRLLRKANQIFEIEQLGFAPEIFIRFQEVIDKPYGIFLITGPTGSGKSFTTFSILKRIATPDKNTITVEDPIEYEIPGINQTQVNPAAGLTFARALRSFLRQDPDIIMVGEIRDSETAKIAVEAALTGHLVIATLHTNDAAGAITRLDEMGVELFNMSASLVGVLAQRLVRKVCNYCKVKIDPDPTVLRRLGLSEGDMAGQVFYRGVGCERCSRTGYRGRYAIHELMSVSNAIGNAIVAGKSAGEIKEIARKGGMKTLREDGILKALWGITTLEEVMARTIE